MREMQMIRLDVRAFHEGSAEGRLGGLGVVQIIKVADQSRRLTRREQAWKRLYWLNGERMPAAKIYRMARELDAMPEDQGGAS